MIFIKVLIASSDSPEPLVSPWAALVAQGMNQNFHAVQRWAFASWNRILAEDSW